MVNPTIRSDSDLGAGVRAHAILLGERMFMAAPLTSALFCSLMPYDEKSSAIKKFCDCL